MKLFGIDYGLVRTGLAATDPDGILAYPLETLDLTRFKDRKALLEALACRIRAERPEAIVVGLPHMPDGTESMTTVQVRNFAQRLLRRTELPVYFMEELLSSEQAIRDLRDAGVTGRKKKAVLDQQAAVRILESFLDRPASGVLLRGPDIRQPETGLHADQGDQSPCAS